MGITEETLRITNEIQYKGKNETRNLKRDLGSIKTGVTAAKDAWEKYSTPLNQSIELLNKVGQSIKAVYETLQQGAQIGAAALTFDSLAQSVGSTSDVMLNELQAATRGTIDDLTLMQSASQFTAMGLAQNSDEAAKLAEIGSTLGAAFRGDAAAGMEEFALLLANQSIPRLDSFGISAGAVRTRIAELQAEFPDMSRETAFMTAVMEEAETTMGKLGDNAAGSAVENLAILETTFENVKAEAILATTEGVNPLLASLVGLVTLSDQTGFNEADFWDGFGGGIANALQSSVRGIDFITLHMRVLSQLKFDNPIAFFDSLNGAIPKMQIMDDAIEANRLTHEAMNEQIAASAMVTIEYSNSVDTLSGTLGDFSEFSGASFIDTLNSTEVATLDVEQALLKQAAAAGADNTSLVLLAAATGDYTDEQINAALEMATMTAFIDSQAAALAAGDITWQQALNSVQSFRAELSQIPDVITVDILVTQSGQFTPPPLPDGTVNGPYATGTPYSPAGMAMVGEYGPEMVRLPRGAQVISTNQTHNQNSTTINGASRRGERAIQDFIRREARPKRIGG